MKKEDNNIILCTFAKKENLKSTKNFIFSKFSPVNIIVYHDVEYNQFMLFYEVSKSVDFRTGVNGTIVIHHKVFTNTYYTVNAINLLVYNEIGTYSIDHKIDWTKHINSLCISINKKEKQELNKINLIFYDKYYNYNKRETNINK